MASENRALRIGSGQFDVVFLSASFISIIPGVSELPSDVVAEVVPDVPEVPEVPDVPPDEEPELLWAMAADAIAREMAAIRRCLCAICVVLLVGARKRSAQIGAYG